MKLISCSRHRTTKFTNSESPIFTTKFLFWFFSWFWEHILKLLWDLERIRKGCVVSIYKLQSVSPWWLRNFSVHNSKFWIKKSQVFKFWLHHDPIANCFSDWSLGNLSIDFSLFKSKKLWIWWFSTWTGSYQRWFWCFWADFSKHQNKLQST